MILLCVSLFQEAPHASHPSWFRPQTKVIYRPGAEQTLPSRAHWLTQQEQEGPVVAVTKTKNTLERNVAENVNRERKKKCWE